MIVWQRCKEKIEKREAAKIVFSDLFIVMGKELLYPSLLCFSVYLNSIPPFGERRKKKKAHVVMRPLTGGV